VTDAASPDPIAARLILASTSPRRRELLTQAGLAFEAIPPGTDGVDETPRPDEPATDYVARLARDKAHAGFQEARRRGVDGPLWVIGADTTVAVDQALLGKPADAREAAAMLRRLSGRSHEVLTGICLYDGQREALRVDVSTVHFEPLGEAAIAAYVASGEPYDKAGGYGIQGRAALMIRRLEGSYSGVMGLPLHALAGLLKSFGAAGGLP